MPHPSKTKKAKKQSTPQNKQKTNLQTPKKSPHGAIATLHPKSQRLLKKSGVLSRYLVVDVLTHLLRQHHSSTDGIMGADTLLNSHPDFIRLDKRDRAFTRHALMTTLRYIPYLDGILKQKITKNPKTVVRHVLRLALTEHFFMNTPAHGVVSSALYVLDGLGYGHAKGLANAVLRHMEKPTESIPPHTTTPPWFWHMLSTDYDIHTATAIVTAHLTPPPLDITVKGNVQQWAETLGGSVVFPDHNGFGGTVRLYNSGDISQLSGYASGDWWVQDGGASLPVKILGNAFATENTNTPLKGKTIADICCAPGGKTLQLVSAGATVTALDNNPKRLQRVRENLKRTGLSAIIHCADAMTYTPTHGQKFDGVLVDAPCSATGTVRRHPELPLLKRPQDFDSLTPLQKNILKNAVAITKSGGYVVFTTCSLRHAEGEHITNWATQNLPVTIAPITAEDMATHLPILYKNGTARTFPQQGLDGFYIVRFLVR